MPQRRVRRRPKRAAICTPYSENAKTGRVAVTYAAQASCPTSCPLLGAGCYAEAGPMASITKRLKDAASGMTPLEVAKAEAAAIDAVPATTDLRLHGVGDCPDDECAATVASAATRFVTRGAGFGVKAWTYTHAWRTVGRESWGGVSVLASCHSVAEAEWAMRDGYAAAVIVESFDGKAWEEYGNGSEPVRLIACRFQVDKTQCVDCRLCMDDSKLLESNSVIAFRAHGAKRKSVVATLNVL